MENNECIDVRMEEQIINGNDCNVNNKNRVEGIGNKKKNHIVESANSTQTEVKSSMNGVKKKTNQYRLVINIDKIRLKPCPKSEKIIRLRKIRDKLSETINNITEISSIKPLNSLSQKSNHSDMENIESMDMNQSETKETKEPVKMDSELETKQSIIKEELDLSNDESKISTNPCANGCKLESAYFNRKQVVYCSRCNKAYMQKRVHLEKKHRCLICKNFFESAQALTEHIKQHLTCGTCGIECQTKKNLEVHKKQHIGRPPHFPFKCHLCTEVFRKEEHVRAHRMNKHYIAKNAENQLTNIAHSDQNTQSAITQTLIEVNLPLKFEVHRCIPCNMTFRNEEAFQRHARSHKSKEALSPMKIVPQSFAQLCPVKFTCRVCSQELNGVAEIDAHTKIHMNEVDKQSLSCTICDQVFSSNELLQEHVRGHLPQIHRCPICSKAFVYKNALKIHLKSHSNVTVSTSQ